MRTTNCGELADWRLRCAGVGPGGRTLCVMRALVVEVPRASQVELGVLGEEDSEFGIKSSSWADAREVE